MVLVKISHHIAGASNHSGHISFIPDGNGIEEEERKDSSLDLGEEFVLADVGCEVGIVEGQVCSIPYELYDLSDLKEILSLKTWNTCLTEEERFSLSAYLPDMDQHTFHLTMKDLLCGNDLFFGSPMEELFERLKSGLYPPKVAHLREGLTFLQRRVFYYSLRSYHDNMYRTFSDMKRMWDQCRPNISVEDRVYIWKRRKNQKGMDSIDLRDLLGKEEIKPLLEKMKCTDHLVAKGNILPPPLLATGMKLVPPKNGAKGVLKIKSGGTNLFPTGVAKAVHSYNWDQNRPSPKGVLKITPKGSFNEQPEPTPLIKGTVSQPLRYSPLPASTYNCDAVNYESELPVLNQKIGGRKVYETSEGPPECIMNRKRAEFFKSATKQNRKIKRSKDLSFHPITDLREQNLFGSDPGKWNRDESSPERRHGVSSNSLKVRKYVSDRENFIQEDGQRSRISLERYPFTTKYYQGEQLMTPISEEHVPVIPLHSQAVSRISDVINGENEAIKRHKDVNVGASKGLQDGPMLPITYKRRKVQSKLNSLDFVKPLNAGADSKSIKERNPPLVEIARRVKINFKNRREISLNKQGS